MIPYGRQEISQDDIEAVVEVLRSDWLTQGPRVPEFEGAIADYVGATYAIAVNSATSALHVACMALDVGPNDIVWTSPNTFVASANCARYCGAMVDFVDISPDTWNICPRKLAKKLAEAKQKNCLPKVVIPVHLCGHSCEMEAISALAQEYDFHIIEDASHAIGGRYQNKPVGNCRYSDITVFSFHPVKIITTAEGGVATTNDPVLAARMARLRSHGITQDPRHMQNPSPGPWYYEQLELGYNYRMTDMQAALGLSQLLKLDQAIVRRQTLAVRYKNLLENLPVTLLRNHPDSYSSTHLYVIRLQLDKIDKTHRQVFDSLRGQGIGVNLHYIPVHTHPYYQQMGFRQGDFPEAECYAAQAISLPMFPSMSYEQQDEVCDVLKRSLA